MALRNNMSREAAEGGTPGAARIDDGGDPGVHTSQVGMHTVAIETFEDMGMEIYQARRDDRPRHLQNAGGLLTSYRWRDVRNRAILNRDIIDSVEIDRWVEHVTTFEDEIVHSLSPIGQRAQG